MKKMSFGKGSGSKSTPKKFTTGGEIPKGIEGGRATLDPSIAALRDQKSAELSALSVNDPGYQQAKDAIIAKYNPLYRAASDIVGAARKVADETPPRGRPAPIKQTAAGIANRVSTPAPPSAIKSRPAMKQGGSVSKASSRADGIAQRGKTKGRYL